MKNKQAHNEQYEDANPSQYPQIWNEVDQLYISKGIENDLEKCYYNTTDSGHSILCLLEQHQDYIVPVTVKRILTDFKIVNIIPVPNDPLCEVIEEDDEFEFLSDNHEGDFSSSYNFEVGEHINRTLIENLARAGKEQAFIHEGIAYIVMPNCSKDEQLSLKNKVTLTLRYTGDIGILTMYFQNMTYDFPIYKNAIEKNKLKIVAIDSSTWKVVGVRFFDLNAKMAISIKNLSKKVKELSDSNFLSFALNAYDNFGKLKIVSSKTFNKQAVLG